MKTAIGLAFIVFGVVLGFYVGLRVCFIGGIVDVIQQIRAEELQALVVAWGIAKVVLASFFGIVSGILPAGIGYYIVTEA
ncbi:MAG: hypothetical protein SVM79_00125 [Chloroflexota bacterium]|nr:hypothetical protein [Chloroflexota bacterium]